jgi:hypothetical protein
MGSGDSNIMKIFFLLWRCDPTRVMTSSFLRFLDHTQRRTTVGRTPLDEWSARCRDNEELYAEYKDLYLESRIKFWRLRWTGLVQRLSPNRIPKRALKTEFTGSWPVERPRFKWQGSVPVDTARLLRCRNWKMAAQSRTVWQQSLWEAKVPVQTVVL